MARSSMAFRLRIDHRRSRIGRYPDTGKATSSQGLPIRILPRWLNATRASRCSLKSMEKILTASYPQTPGPAAQVTDLGSWSGTGRPQNVHHGHGYYRLLLRSSEPMAARNERKHQPAAAPVLPEGYGSLSSFAVGSEQSGPEVESAP